jgi:hypothetical protein
MPHLATKYLGQQLTQQFLPGRRGRLVRQQAGQFRHRQCGDIDRARRRGWDVIDNHDSRWHAAVTERFPGVGMQLRYVQAGAGRDDVGDQALVSLAGGMLDDRNVGEPRIGSQG